MSTPRPANAPEFRTASSHSPGSDPMRDARIRRQRMTIWYLIDKLCTHEAVFCIIANPGASSADQRCVIRYSTINGRVSRTDPMVGGGVSFTHPTSLFAAFRNDLRRYGDLFYTFMYSPRWGTIPRQEEIDSFVSLDQVTVPSPISDIILARGE